MASTQRIDPLGSFVNYSSCPQAAAGGAALLADLQSRFASAKLPSLPVGLNKAKLIRERKEEVLAAIEGLERGLSASPEDQERVDAAARSLEALNPNPKSLSAKAINGKWELIYTTSDSILGKSKPAPFRPQGPIYQTIDAVRLRAKNQEGTPFFNSVAAELTPTSASAVDVQFVLFRIFGLIPVKASASAKGSLDTTFVDEEIRISRGNKNNLFILRQADPEATLDGEWP